MNNIYDGIRHLTIDVERPSHGAVVKVNDDIVMLSMDSTDPASLVPNDVHYAREPFKCDFFLVIMCVRGALRLRLNLVDHQVERNDVLIIYPGMVCEFLHISEDYDMKVIAGAVRTNGTYNIIRRFQPSDIFKSHSIIHATEAEMRNEVTLFNMAFERLRQEGYERKQEVVTGLACMMAADLWQISQSETNRATDEGQMWDRNKQIAMQFVCLVLENSTVHRELSFYASEMCLSVKHMSHVVMKSLGKSASQVIRDNVILEAKAMLRNRDMTIQAVSDALNFANQSFFGTYFKKATGMSPKAYKELGRG